MVDHKTENNQKKRKKKAKKEKKLKRLNGSRKIAFRTN